MGAVTEPVAVDTFDHRLVVPGTRVECLRRNGAILVGVTNCYKYAPFSVLEGVMPT